MEKLQQVLAGKPDLESLDAGGNTPLMVASIVGCVEMAQELLAKGASIEGAACLVPPHFEALMYMQVEASWAVHR